MSQSEDESSSSSVPECTSQRASPRSSDDALVGSAFNEPATAPDVQIDNFVAPAPAPADAQVELEPAAASAAAAASCDDDDAGADHSSSPVNSLTLAPAPASQQDAELELELERVQLLREVAEKASSIDASLEAERLRQHSAMLVALEQRSKAAVAERCRQAGDGGEAAVSDDRPAAHADLAQDEQDASDGSERDGAPAVSVQGVEEDGAVRRSRSASPEASSRLQQLRPDTRIHIPSLQPQLQAEAEAASARDKVYEDRWVLRQENVDPALLAQLTDMGFDVRVAVVALERTASASLQEAIDFCLDHNNEDYAGGARTDGGDSDTSSDISLHEDRADGDDDGSFSAHSRASRAAAADNDIDHESQLLRLFVELLRGSDGPHTVSGRGLFAEGSGAAVARPGSLSRHTSAPGHVGPPLRSFGVLEQLQQLAAQRQLERVAPLPRSHSGPARMPPFVAGHGSALGLMRQVQLHQQQQRAASAANGGSAETAGVMQADFIECSYCFDSVPKQDIKSMPCCLFNCCGDCMRQDFTVRINDGNTLIRCHHCGNSVSDDFIRQCVTISTFTKFLRFKAARENPLLRSCSKCCHVQEGKSSKPSMTCAGCSHVYCFTHGDSHPGQSCADWVRSHAAVEKATASQIKKDSKKCPQCRVVTYKTDGCNHMHCSRCGCDWCWICASKFDAQGRAYPLHYKWWNFFGCGGMQFNTCWGTSLAALYLKRFLTMLFVIVAGPLGLAAGATVLALYLALFIPVMLPAYIYGHKRYRPWAYSFGEFFMHSLKKMIQVFGILILAPPALALAIALFPVTILVLRRLYSDDD